MRADPVLALLLCGTLHAAAPEDARALLDHYCVGCHNTKSKTGGLTLEGADLTDVSARAAVWEKVIQKLRANVMPPPGLPRPNVDDHRVVVSWLERSRYRAAVEI